MDGGPRYEIGTTAPSKALGMLMLLIFGCGSYLRYSNIYLITDSAYGFIEGMAILSLWGIVWVTSLRISTRRGFMGIKELQIADKDRKSSISLERNYRSDIKKWENSKKTAKKGTSWCWKSSLDILNGLSTPLYLTAVQDSKICWRIDNFLGSFYKVPMRFWDYEEDEQSQANVKRKKYVESSVAECHSIFRNDMGPVDQSDVKAFVMNLSREGFPN